MRKKICVYAICKNEVKSIKKWYDSMKEADYIAVLDTGSDDGSYELLKGLGVITKQQEVIPWRFDVARNLSAELVPNDTEICVCTDIDEVFEAGWREKLEDAWKDDTTSARYRYTWNFYDDGREKTVFYAQKIHKKGAYVWHHPVHEVLKYVGTEEEKTVTAKGIQLNHFADNTKSRASYLGLLELSVREDPTDDRNMHYLGREYMFRGMWKEAIETLQRHLALPRADWRDERSASMRYLATCFCRLNQRQEAYSWLYRAIAEAPYMREPYIELATLMYEDENWDGVIFAVGEALKIQYRQLTYISDGDCWGAKPYDLLSLGLFYSGRFTESLENAEKAYALSPNDERLKNNIEIIEKRIASHSN